METAVEGTSTRNRSPILREVKSEQEPRRVIFRIAERRRNGGSSRAPPDGGRWRATGLEEARQNHFLTGLRDTGR